MQIQQLTQINSPRPVVRMLIGWDERESIMKTDAPTNTEFPPMSLSILEAIAWLYLVAGLIAAIWIGTSYMANDPFGIAIAIAVAMQGGVVWAISMVFVNIADNILVIRKNTTPGVKN